VASAHWNLPIPLINNIPFSGNGSFSVSIFFIFSGFYTGLILDNSYNSIKSFYIARFIRIFPSYWFNLLILISLFFVTKEISFGTFSLSESQALLLINDLSISQLMLVVWANLLIFGIDFLHFFNLGKLAFFPPAWSLSVEILFYLIAPILVKFKNKVLIFLVLLSLLIRALTFYLGYTEYIWRHLFFPSELIFFLQGIISYRIYIYFFKNSLPTPPYFISKYIKDPLYLNNKIFVLVYFFKRNKNFQKIFVSLFYLLFILLLNRKFFPGNELNLLILSFLVVFMSPLLFYVCKNSKIDRLFGDFSYVLYLLHFASYKISSYFFSSKYNYAILLIVSATIYLTYDKRVRRLLKMYLGGG